MAETITCTQCGVKLRVAALPPPGRKVRCSKCGEAFIPQAQLPDQDEEEEKLEKRPVAKSSRKRDENEEDDDRDEAPRRTRGRAKHDIVFDGGPGDFFVVYLVCMLLTVITFGLAFPWTSCKFEKWKTEHTLINGRRLRFDGKGSELLGLFIVMYLLIIITLGIYMFWAVPKFCRWVVENTSFDDQD